MSTQALRERLAALNKEANHLLAEKGAQVWSKEDQAKFDGLMDEAERAQSQLNAIQRQLEASREEGFDDAPRKRKDAEPNAAREGFEIFLRKQAKHYSDEDVTKVRNVMSTTTGSEGGNTVQPAVAAELIDLLKAYTFVRRVADQVTTETGVDMSYPTSDGTSEVGEIVAQNAQANGADPTFGTRALNVFKYGSRIITVPVELLQDSQIDIVAMVLKRARDRLGRIQNQHFTVGTGTGQPTGITVAATTGKTGTTGQTTTVIYDDLVDLVDSLDAAYLDVPSTAEQLPGVEPGFMFSQTMRRVIRKIKDTAGRPIWTPSYDAGMAAKTPDMLLGYPVYINNDMPAPAANAKSIAFGNFRRYLIRDAMQTQFFRFDDSAYMSKGQVGFLAWARAGGNLMDLNSIKCYAHSAT